MEIALEWFPLASESQKCFSTGYRILNWENSTKNLQSTSQLTDIKKTTLSTKSKDLRQSNLSLFLKDVKAFQKIPSNAFLIEVGGQPSL